MHFDSAVAPEITGAGAPPGTQGPAERRHVRSIHLRRAIAPADDESDGRPATRADNLWAALACGLAMLLWGVVLALVGA